MAEALRWRSLQRNSPGADSSRMEPKYGPLSWPLAPGSWVLAHKGPVGDTQGGQGDPPQIPQTGESRGKQVFKGFRGKLAFPTASGYHTIHSGRLKSHRNSLFTRGVSSLCVTRSKPRCSRRSRATPRSPSPPHSSSWAASSPASPRAARRPREAERRRRFKSWRRRLRGPERGVSDRRARLGDFR